MMKFKVGDKLIDNRRIVYGNMPIRREVAIVFEGSGYALRWPNGTLTEELSREYVEHTYELEQPEEKKYTLEEAWAELNRRECRRKGHDYEQLHEYATDGPVRIFCSLCGKSWKVTEDDG